MLVKAWGARDPCFLSPEWGLEAASLGAALWHCRFPVVVEPRQSLAETEQGL